MTFWKGYRKQCATNYRIQSIKKSMHQRMKEIAEQGGEIFEFVSLTLNDAKPNIDFVFLRMERSVSACFFKIKISLYFAKCI